MNDWHGILLPASTRMRTLRRVYCYNCSAVRRKNRMNGLRNTSGPKLTFFFVETRVRVNRSCYSSPTIWYRARNIAAERVNILDNNNFKFDFYFYL
jgi:hypothetical protein